MKVGSYIYTNSYAPADTNQLWVKPMSNGEATLYIFVDGKWTPTGGVGESAYEAAVKAGFNGSKEEWLDSLALKYSDLTAEQKADLVKDAVSAAERAAQAVENIENAINDIDVSSTDGAITALAAKQGALENEVDVLGPKIDQIEKSIYEKVQIPVNGLGYTIRTNYGIGEEIGVPALASGWAYLRYPVVAGDVVIVSGVGGWQPLLWCFVDSDGIILSASNGGASATNLKVIAPSNAAEVIINTSTPSTACFYIPKDSIGEAVNVIRDDMGNIMDEGSVYKKYGSSDITTGVFYNFTGLTVGAVYDGSTASSADYSKYSVITLSAYQKIRIATLGGANARSYAICDAADNKVLALAASNEDTRATPFVYTADRKVYVYINDKTPFSGIVSVKGMIDDRLRSIEQGMGAIAEVRSIAEDAAESVSELEEEIISKQDFLFSDVEDRYFYNERNLAVGDNYYGVKTEYNYDNTWGVLPPISLKNGQSITIKTMGGANGRAYCICSASGVILDLAASGANTLNSPYTYTATQDVIVYVNCRTELMSDTTLFGVSTAENKIDGIEKSIQDLDDKIDAAIVSFNLAVPKTSNPLVDMKARTPLKILDIGNSFTVDALAYIQELVTAAGLDTTDMSLYYMVRSSGSFDTFIKSWNNEDTYNGNEGCFYWSAKALGANQTISGSNDLERMHNAIKNVKWDVILIHQVSEYSDDYEQWEGTSTSGHLKEFMRILRTYQPQAMIGLLAAHASFQTSTNGDTATFWQKTMDGVRWMRNHYGIDFVIPIATAIENLRASSLNASPVAYGFSRDKHHLGFGIARYVAAATYFQAIIGARYGVSVLGNSAVHEVTSSESSSATYPNECVDVTNANKEIAQKCAVLACSDMFTINNPDEVTI